MPGLGPPFERLDRFVAERMAAARTPGMAIALFDRAGQRRLATYGFADPEAGTPVLPETLFEVGSITKSFTALAVLQAAERGRLDLHRPVTDYLPWFRVRTRFAPITPHHLLTHSAGLVTVIDRSPDVRGAVWALRETAAAWPPGSRFFYSDAGYQTLALILEAVTGRAFPDVIREQIFEPLGMAASVAALTHAVRPRLARGYRPLYDDRPAHASHPLVPVTWIEASAGDCSVASTAGDMAAYGRLWLNRGEGPRGRLLSPAGYALLVHPHMAVGPDGPSEAYGYGMGRETRDGVTHLTHGGGMPGYVAHLNLDVDNGLGVITLSTTPHVSGISWDVLRFWRAAALGRPLDAVELGPPPDPYRVQNAADFAGRYRRIGPATGGSDGAPPAPETLTLAAAGDAGQAGERLILHHQGQEIALERRGPDSFYVAHPDFDRFLLRFRRAAAGAGDGGEAPGAPPGPVAEAVYGPERYPPLGGEAADAPRHPPAWEAYPGHYRAHNPWMTNVRVVLRAGELLLVRPEGGETPLVPAGETEGEFRVGHEPTPERLRFDQIADGRALRATLSACDYYRFFVP